MKARYLKAAAVVAAITLCVLAVACQGRNAGSVSASAADGTAPESAGAVSPAGDEQWPGQSLGYVGPNGEGVLDPQDFATYEDYRDAAIDAAGKEADVPSEVVEREEGGYGFMRGKVWLDFREGCGEKRARDIVAECGGLWVSSTYKWGSRSAETYFSEAGDFDAVMAMCDRLMAYEEVEAAYPELISASGDLHCNVDDAYSSDQDYLASARFYEAWDVVRCEESASVAVLDSGACRLHEDLRENIYGGYDAYNSIRLNMSDCEDTCGHGTNTAGVACAVAMNGKGVAGCSYNARLKPIRVTSSGDAVDVAAVKRGLEYLRDIDTPDVVSMSFGMSAIENWLPSSLLIQNQIQGVVDDLHDAGVVLVASVGNDSNSTEHYPAKFGHMVGVGSVESDLAHTSISNDNDTVDICAFGSGACSTGNPAYYPYANYVQGLSGTSFAAPQVAAAAALLKAQDPSRSAEDVEELLLGSAVHPSDFVDADGDGKDDLGRYGYGALDAAAAVGWTAPGSSPDTGGSLAEMYAEARR